MGYSKKKIQSIFGLLIAELLYENRAAIVLFSKGYTKTEPVEFGLCSLLKVM